MTDQPAKIDDGGPAFPCNVVNCCEVHGDPVADISGMSLRQWYAGQALANPGLTSGVRANDGQSGIEATVILCYRFADTMLAARKAVPA